MPKSPQEWAEAVIGNLESRTGRTIDQWLLLVKQSKLTEHKEIVAWLKSEHSLGQNTAFMIADKALGSYDDPVALLNDMYKGKETLLPLYESIVALAGRLGEELTVYQCKTYTVLRRGRQFAVIKPTTKTRIDVGFALPGVSEQGRLLLAKNLGGGNRITHRMEVHTSKDINEELRRWLTEAFERDLPADSNSKKEVATLFR